MKLHVYFYLHIGNIYIADYDNYRIRKVTSSIINTIAGNGEYTYSGDNGPATSAGMVTNGVALDSSANVYIIDYPNQRIRKVTVSTNIITTYAGLGTTNMYSTGEYSGDGGPATAAEISNPADIAFDSSGTCIYLYSRSYFNTITSIIRQHVYC